MRLQLKSEMIQRPMGELRKGPARDEDFQLISKGHNAAKTVCHLLLTSVISALVQCIDQEGKRRPRVALLPRNCERVDEERGQLEIDGPSRYVRLLLNCLEQQFMKGVV